MSTDATEDTAEPELDVKGNPITEDPKADGPVSHEYTREIVCPYCGHEHGDSWEVDSDGRQQCGNCEREFDMERVVDVTYRTARIDRVKEAADREKKLERMAKIKAACDAFPIGARVRCTGGRRSGKLATVVPRKRAPQPDEYTFVRIRIDGALYGGEDSSEYESPDRLEIVEETPA